MVYKASVQEQVLAVSRDYLGPASERFITRQVSTHLQKSIEEITKADIAKLVEWIRLSFAHLTNDTQLVDEYAERLLKIAKNGARKTASR